MLAPKRQYIGLLQDALTVQHDYYINYFLLETKRIPCDIVLSLLLLYNPRNLGSKIFTPLNKYTEKKRLSV